MSDVFYFKMLCIIAGLVIIFLGYRLFVKGIFNESGDIEGNWRSTKLIIKKAAPGTYFVLFGSLIICSAIYKGFSHEEYYGADRSNLLTIPRIDTARKSPLTDTDKIKIQ